MLCWIFIDCIVFLFSVLFSLCFVFVFQCVCVMFSILFVLGCFVMLCVLFYLCSQCDCVSPDISASFMH